MNEKMDRICAAVVKARPEADVPPWFAAKVMAHVREQAEAALESWFTRRVAMPLMAGGGVASLGFGLAWIWLVQGGYMTELSLLLSGNIAGGF